MSAFEVNLTPTRLKLNKKLNDAKEPTDVILAPFSAKAIVTFENVPVSKHARRILNILNPSDDEIKVMVTKGFKPEHNMSLEWTSNVISAQTQITMEITWNPLKEISCKESIQLMDSRNFRKDIIVILKSIPKPKTSVKRYPNISSGVVPVKTLKLKSPTGNQKQSLILSSRKRQNNLQQQTETNKLNKRNSNVISPILKKNDYKFEFNLIAKSNSTKSTLTNKENVCPLTPNNISSILDNIQFTPGTETKSKGSSHLDYLASLPTPTCIRNNDNIIEDNNCLQPRRLPIEFSPETTNSSPARQINNLHFESTPYNKSNLLNINVISNISDYVSISNEICPSKTFTKDSESDKNITQTKLSQIQTINKTFDINSKNSETLHCSLDLSHDINECIEKKIDYIKEKQYSFNDETLLGTSSRLSVIEEECASKKSPNSDNSQELNIATTVRRQDKNLKRDIKLIGTPLRKYSESMRDLSLNKSPQFSAGIQGSMPNLNNMEKIQSIEQNRYFNSQQPVKIEFLEPINTNMNLSDCSSMGDSSLTSTVSAVDIVFNQNEILAASSRFNIHETGRKKSSPLLKHETRTPINHFKKSNTSLCNSSKYQKRTREVYSPNSINYLQLPKAINMNVSPPKRTKLSDDYVDLPGINFRTNKWGHIQPKKLRIQKTLSLVRKPVTPRKIKLEPERQPLYDNDIILRGYINPDPFAATTTCDPFLSHSIYIDNRSLKKYEIQMKKWLNALVSMPAEFDPDCEERVDVGKIFNEVRNKELILAPTKEEQSMTYLTKARMGTLRTDAYRLYISDEMCGPCGKVAVYIKKGAIKIRQDRDLHLDVVMQRNILELLLSFNPLWLRIGLEVVFNEEIHLHSNSDIVGLSTFILNRLFKDKFMERKYSKAYTLSDEYSNHIKSFSLQNILFLLLFLDKAKNNRIIKHNPCLFVKKSKHKTTKDILLRFSSELLASVGDITKDLKRLGYVLTHKQNFIDEFDYAFNNLAVDLRDGVRLTRVMEIILLRDDLTKQLRCPAISRLQRIFNVNLGLIALADAEFDLNGNISAADIVDGFREKTLSLLWQIIYKFRAPKFVAAAKILQKWWRHNWLKVFIKRRIQYREEMRKNNAALVLQTAFRSYMARKYVKIFKWERTIAAICLQKYCRRLLAIKKLKITLNSIVFIQRWYRRTKLQIIERTKFIQIRNSAVIIQCWYRRLILAKKIEYVIPIIRQAKAEAKLKYEKAIILQRSIKSFIIHKKLQSIVNGFIISIQRSNLKYKSATKIQSFFKMIQVRKEFLLKRCAVNKIQKYWISYQQMRIERARFIGKRQAVIAIQKQFKSYKLMKSEREYYLKLKKNVLNVQNRFRANKLCQNQRKTYQEIKRNTIIIQTHWKAHLLMRKIHGEYIINRQRVIRIQQIFRANREMSLEREKYSLLKYYTINIQRKYRAKFLMRIQKLNYEKLRTSTLVIQRKLRATLLMRKIQYQFIQMQYNSTLIQQRFRANRLMKKEHTDYLKLKQYTVLVQRRFRANLLKQKICFEFLQLKKATIIIQQQYKSLRLMRKNREEYLNLKNATCLIQQKFRALLDMRKKKAEYLILKKSTILIQRMFRANKEMKIQRKRYNSLRKACVLIQIKFKANTLARTKKNEYISLRNSAIIIQQYYRAFCKMRANRTNYFKIKQAAIVIQQKFRATLLMRKTRNDYIKLKKACIVLQQNYRAICAKRIVQMNYCNLKTSAIIIQQHFRALVLMRQERVKYLNIIKSICILQQQFRAFNAMRKQREEYLKLKASVVNIQRRYRANMYMRFERNKYDNLQLATLIIQQRFHAICAMRRDRSKYLQLKQATLTIQQKYRATVTMRNIKQDYEIKKKSIIFLQRKFRANLKMKKALCEYNSLRESAIIIQRTVRAYFAMNLQRKQFLKQKSSALQIQNWFRSLRIMWQIRNEYQLKIKSINIIQIRLRSTLQMRLEKLKYLQIRQSTIRIQQIFKSYIKMKTDRTNYLELKNATLIIQQRYRAKCEMLKLRNQYLLIHSLIVCIQRKFRANILMNSERKKFLILKTVTIKIQQIYRANNAMREQSKKYIKLRETILNLQTYARGFLARKTYHALMTPEMKKLLREKRAAKIIQRYWRGYCVRKKFRNLKLVVLRERIRELKNTATACNTVRYKITETIKFLKGPFHVQEVLSVLSRLDNISRTVPHLLMNHSDYISTFCYGIMAQTIRSEVDKQVIEHCSRIILNLVRYNSTTANTFQENGLVTIAQMLLRWCDKECNIFNTLCTLIWIFAHCPIKKKKIRNFMIDTESIYLLRETKKLILRKDNMRLNVRKSCFPIVNKNVQNFSPKALPSLEPDFGLIRGKPYVFISSVFAFEIVLKKLGINNIF